MMSLSPQQRGSWSSSTPDKRDSLSLETEIARLKMELATKDSQIHHLQGQVAQYVIQLQSQSMNIAELRSQLEKEKDKAAHFEKLATLKETEAVAMKQLLMQNNLFHQLAAKMEAIQQQQAQIITKQQEQLVR